MKTILLQFDTDAAPSSFDRITAVDAGVDEIVGYSSITPENVTPLVHGAMFTRGNADLKNTAVFIGGSDVTAGEAVLERVCQTFFGPVRVSVMMDSNGSNTTAAAAVLSAGRHVELAGSTAVVAGGTGPVGQRAAFLLASAGANVRLCSRSLDRAMATSERISVAAQSRNVTGVAAGAADALIQACEGSQILIAAGALGVQFLSEAQLAGLPDVRVAVDLNAVPPSGLGGVDAMDKAAEKLGRICYGPIGVGGLKMRIHKVALQSLFESNDRALDAAAIYDIGRALV